ncbi:phage tail assembly protein [Micromonospora sp. NPDC049751]|uniref:phage tail assembly protein n=1 Tax=Micromonospora sp. NPDC049751 TaxID=3154837 RepID=UPI0033DAA69E
MATITLDSIRAAAEAKYGSLDIELGDETVRLLNPLRLSKANRDALLAVQSRLNAEDDDADQGELLTEALRLVVDGKTKADKLIKALGGDLALLAEVFESYVKGTQAGEASGSDA